MDLFDDGKKEALLDHVRKEDVGYIKTVDQKVLLNARDENGNTVLLIASNKGNLNICKEILKKCPTLLYQENNYNSTVLHEATDSFILRENFWFIDFFVSVGVDELDTSNEGGIYLKFKRWLKMQDYRGDTALVIAARTGNLHVVHRFIEVDRQYHLGLSQVVGDEGKTALDWAVEKEDLEMVKLLTDKGDPYSDFIPHSTAMDLFLCVKRGDLDDIKTVELNVLLNSRDKFRMSALCIATKCDRLDCCKEILKRCPSLLYHQNNDKCSVLHHAADQKYYELIDFYVSVGLQAAKSEGGTDNMIRFKNWINLQNRGGNTTLTLAVIRGCHGMVKRFAEVDCQYNLGLSEIVGSNKMTALQWAKHNKDKEMINTLTGSRDTNCNGAGAVSESNILTFAEVSKHNNLKEHEMIKTLTGSGDPNLDYGANSDDDNIPVLIAIKQAQESLQTAKSSGTGVTMDKFDVEVCDSITSSLRKLASDKPQPYSWAQLKEFTKDFSQRLGFGGSGDVYKGQFSDGGFIAVKVLKNIEFMEKQFVAEIDTMGRAYHHNLIKLHGYCYEANTKFKAIVYDYMENGSFDKILFEKTLDIPWAKLQNIAKEIAQGISYLHEGCQPIIIHQDIKPSNVLLDSNLSPKVTDFGLAKILNMGESQFEQTKIKGSLNYIAPEVNQLEKVKLSCKLDVYSFGIILFDILGSKRNYVDKRWFPSQVLEKYKTNQLDKFIVECGINEEDKENAKRLAIIALLCVEHNPRARPMLSTVVKMLEGKVKLGTPFAPFYPDYFSSESSSMNDSRDC